MRRWLGVVFGLIALLPECSAAQEPAITEGIFSALAHVVAKGHDANGVSYSASATGFVVNPEGKLLTVYHVIDQIGAILPPTLQLTVQLGTETFDFDASAIAFSDKLADLLVLNIPTPAANRKSLCFIRRGEEDGLIINQTPIFSSGFPTGVPYINTRGLVTARQGPGNTWLTTVAIYPGQSGSPVYTSDGRVIALAKGEEKALPGMFAIIPVPNVRAQLENFIRDCTQRTSAAPVSSAPLPSECIFIGKLSALGENSVFSESEPFGRTKLSAIVQKQIKTPFTLTAMTAVNIRSTCPVVRETGAVYGGVTRTLRAGQEIQISDVVPLEYAGDTFYWGSVSK